MEPVISRALWWAAFSWTFMGNAEFWRGEWKQLLVWFYGLWNPIMKASNLKSGTLVGLLMHDPKRPRRYDRLVGSRIFSRGLIFATALRRSGFYCIGFGQVHPSCFASCEMCSRSGNWGLVGMKNALTTATRCSVYIAEPKGFSRRVYSSISFLNGWNYSYHATIDGWFVWQSLGFGVSLGLSASFHHSFRYASVRWSVFKLKTGPIIHLYMGGHAWPVCGSRVFSRSRLFSTYSSVRPWVNSFLFNSSPVPRCFMSSKICSRIGN